MQKLFDVYILKLGLPQLVILRQKFTLVDVY